MANSGARASWVISFGPFRVARARRLVERNGEAVRLGSRAFDVLVHLLEHAGQVVSHRALLEAVWPGTYVEEGNLRFQMAALRKALGGGDASYIINVPGRGYCFTAPISKQNEVKYSPPLLNDATAQPVSPAIRAANEDATNVLPYPLLQLSVANARRTMSAVFPDEERRCVAEARAKLDDLALAIELAASHVKMFGIEQLFDLLEQRWLPSSPSWHVTLPRQQTLYAMLDRSYRLLSDEEKHAFRYVSVFSGQFDLDAADAVLGKNAETASLLAGLASRSLLSLNQSKRGTRYRLLDTTRAYARDRLAEAGEVGEARRRHATFFTQMLQNLKNGHLSRVLMCEIDDLLAAIILGFAPEHGSTPCRRALGVKLAPVG